MRWKFANPLDNNEAAEREKVIQRIDAWWTEFRRRSDEIKLIFQGKSSRDLPEWMHTHFSAINPRIMWEYGPALQGTGHRLAITSEATHHLRPLVDVILDRAPTIDGWEFYPYRPAEDVAVAVLSAESRAKMNIADYRAKVRRGNHHRVDVCYYSGCIADENDSSHLHGAFVATESLLGEEYLDQWIGTIEVKPLKRASWGKRLLGIEPSDDKHLIPLDRLKATVDALIESMREQLPKDPHYLWPDSAQWTLWELNPVESTDDYINQQDLIVARSPNRTMWTAAHSDDVFFSNRFSRAGETFCYVKIDGSNGLGEAGFADKAEIEDAIDEILKPNMLGCAIGGGTGLRYSYIDIALVDLKKGIEAVRRRLQKGIVPKRSWIQFFDSSLAAEWVGIYDDSPAPPLPCFDERANN